MNKDQCLIADWRTIGYENGSTGKNEGLQVKRREACAKHRIAQELDRYLIGRHEGTSLIGRHEGLILFCRPRVGFYIGRQGQHYNNVCPTESEDLFLTAFKDGRRLFEREQDFNYISNAIAAAISKIEILEQQINSKTFSLVENEITNADRINIAAKINEMAEHKGRLQERLPNMRADLGRTRHELISLREKLLSNYPDA